MSTVDNARVSVESVFDVDLHGVSTSKLASGISDGHERSLSYVGKSAGAFESSIGSCMLKASREAVTARSGSQPLAGD